MLPASQNSSSNTSRFAEMLEQLKSEYDQLHQEAVVYKMQKDDLEHKGNYWWKKESSVSDLI